MGAFINEIMNDAFKSASCLSVTVLLNFFRHKAVKVESDLGFFFVTKFFLHGR